MLLPLALFSAACVVLAQGDPPKPVISKDPLTAEQIAIYRAVLQDYMKVGDGRLNLADRTAPLSSYMINEANECLKGSKYEVPSPTKPVVHRLDPAVALSPRMVLVDPEKQNKAVEGNDPDHVIRRAIDDHQPVSDKELEQSVKQAFASGLFTLSEIVFDKSHTHAVLQYSFYCGMLCGHGNTVRLKKVDGVWKMSGKCGGWVS